jgi:hypothetical protein
MSFMDWWRSTNELDLGLVWKGLDSMIILRAWTLWKHRNCCIFDGIAPSMTAAITQAEEKRRVWEMAEAKGITSLMAQLPAV